jgi:hypothetical protein
MVLNVRYPDIGPYGPGTIPQSCYNEMTQAVEQQETTLMLTAIAWSVGYTGDTGVAFVTSDEPGVNIFLDGESEVVFALGEDVLFPGNDGLPFGEFLVEIIRAYYSPDAPVP